MRLEIKPKSGSFQPRAATLNFLATGSESLKLHPGPTSLPVQTRRGRHASISWPAHWRQHTAGRLLDGRLRHPGRPAGTPAASRSHHSALSQAPCLKGDSRGRHQLGGLLRGINKQKERMSLSELSGPQGQTLKFEVSKSSPQNHDLGLEHGEV